MSAPSSLAFRFADVVVDASPDTGVRVESVGGSACIAYSGAFKRTKTLNSLKYYPHGIFRQNRQQRSVKHLFHDEIRALFESFLRFLGFVIPLVQFHFVHEIQFLIDDEGMRISFKVS
jgi:hypothetical protein